MIKQGRITTAKKEPVCIPMGEAGYRFKGVKGIKAKTNYIDIGQFSGSFDEDEIHQIGRQYIDGYNSDEVDGDGSEIVWDWLMSLQVEADKKSAKKKEPKPKMKKSFSFDVSDPTVWAKAPNQVKVFLNNLSESGLAHATEEEMIDFSKNLVEEGKLVTRQDPYSQVFMYYVKDKKRGFHEESKTDWAKCVQLETEPVAVEV